MNECEESWKGIDELTTNYFCSLQKNCLQLIYGLNSIMKPKISQQMGGDLTAKHFCASVKLLYAAGKTDFYLRQNELVAIAIPEVDDK